MFATAIGRVEKEEMARFTELLAGVTWKVAAGRDYQTADVTGLIPGYSRALFLKLPPGGVLHWHSDAGDVETEHVVLLTNRKSRNLWKHEGVEGSDHMAVGMRYKVDRTLLHAAENLGKSDRVHLLLER